MKKPYTVAAALLVFIGFDSWYHYSVKERGERNAAVFHTSEINGKITYISANAGAVYLKVANNEESTCLYQQLFLVKGMRVFRHLPKKGTASGNRPVLLY